VTVRPASTTSGAGPETLGDGGRLAALLDRPRSPGPASGLRCLLAQARVEFLLTVRQGENVLVTLVLPLILLVFFASVRLDRARGRPAVDFLVPGVLTLAVMSSGMVTLGIATGYQRAYGVLKRLGGSPLTRAGLLGAKALAVLGLELLQVTLVCAVAALAYGWRPAGDLVLASALLLGGAATFAACGMLLAGGLRAEVTLGVANGLYLMFLILGGVVVPVSHLPAVVQPLARVLPVTALSQSLRGALSASGHVALSDGALLIAWGVVLAALAVRWFRWE